MTSVKSIAWLAGVLEGEGCFKLSGNGGSIPAISIAMTDEDTIQKIAIMFGRQYSGYPSSIGLKKIYSVVIYGTPAIEWMMTIYTFMSVRRKGRIKEIINVWKESISRSRDKFQCGHPKTTENSRLRGRGNQVRCKICATRLVERYRTEQRMAKLNGTSQETVN